jgi:ABC-type antimicrobial peptide transport system permease subunit
MAVNNPLLSNPGRLALTVMVVGACTLLMLFLWSDYQGVNEGAVDYIRRTSADFWVLQGNSTNIIRGFSIMSMRDYGEVRSAAEVESASPVLLLCTSANVDARDYTLYLAGYYPQERMGGPPALAAGRAPRDDGEIVLDRVFAKKHHLGIGQTIRVQRVDLRIVGLSNGTNAMVIQYAFVTLSRAQAIAGFPGLISFVAVRVKADADKRAAIEALRSQRPDLNFFEDREFINNNVQEMQSGFLAFLFIITLMGAGVLAVVLILLFSLSILEKRKEFVIMKALGAPRGFIPSLVVAHAAVLGGAGAVLGILLLFPVRAAINALSPELETGTYPLQMAAVTGAVLAVSMISSAIAARRLSRFYALEAFRGREE